MNIIDVAWKIIDHWIADDYDGDKAAMIDEAGNLDDYAMRITETIERYNLGTDDIHHCALMVELYI